MSEFSKSNDDNEPVEVSEPVERIELAASVKQKIIIATERLAAAERELTLAMETISVPELGADNEMIGERLRSALNELGAARQALEIVLEGSL